MVGMTQHLDLFFEEISINTSYSQHTLAAYKRDLKLYQGFLKESKNVSLFYEYIDKKGLSSRSKARVVSSVRSYLAFLERKGQKTQLKKLSPVPIHSKKLPKLISTKEFKAILKASETKDPCRSARNKMTLMLLFGLGCRISEVIQLNLQDINSIDRSMTVTGKRNKQRLLPLTGVLYEKLNEYIDQYRPGLLLKHQKNHSLLINNRGKRPSRVDVWRWLQDWSKKAGFSEVKSPHQFRHGFATGLMENGADLRSIQFLLGHSSIQTTQIYTSVKQEHLQKTIALHHPLSEIKIKN